MRTALRRLCNGIASNSSSRSSRNAVCHGPYSVTSRPASSYIINVIINPDHLHVRFDQGKQAEFYHKFLRDHCMCDQCYHPQTHQRLVDTHTIDDNIKPVKVEMLHLPPSRSEAAGKEATELAITWSDEHVSRFPYEWLDQRTHHKQRTPSGKPKLWKAQLFDDLTPVVAYEEVTKSDEGLYQWLHLIHTYGFAFVEGVPVDKQKTQELLERIGIIRDTLFGAMWDFQPGLEHSDTAYTSLKLNSHTDGCYSTEQPGLQSLHCIELDAVGGESILVDGFKVASTLKETCPESFEYFTRVAIPFQYRDPDRGIHLLNRTPVISLDEDGHVAQFRYNNDDRAPLSVSLKEQKEFYHHLRKLLTIVRDPSFEYRFKLVPGKMLTFHNHRVQHGRESFTGHRRIVGCYHGEDDFLSKLRVLEEAGHRALH